MFTLQSYKEQVYNIGCPSQTPSKPPLKTLPQKLDREFCFSPVKGTPESFKPKVVKSKIPIKPTRKQPKRKIDIAEESSSESPVKKLRMISKEEFDEAKKENQTNIDKVLASLGSLSAQLVTLTDETKRNNSEVKEEISFVNAQMRNIQSSMEDTWIKFESKLVEIEGTVHTLQKTVPDTNTLCRVTKQSIRNCRDGHQERHI